MKSAWQFIKIARQSIDVESKIIDSQALRFAIASTLSVIFSSLVVYFGWHTPFFLLYIICSAIFVFFSYGKTYKSQSLMILTGVSICAISCFIATLLSSVLWLSGLYLFVFSALIYFYSTLNTGSLFIAKFTLVPLSFAILSTSHSFHYAMGTFYIIYAGGVSAFLANSILFFISEKNPIYFIHKQWHSAIEDVLAQLTDTYQPYDTSALEKQTMRLSQCLNTSNANFILSCERFSHAIIKFMQLIKSHPWLLEKFDENYKKIFQAIYQNSQRKGSNSIDTAYAELKQRIDTLRQQSYFIKLPSLLRREYAELFFIGEKIVADSQEIFKNPPKSTAVKKPSLLQLIATSLHTIKDHWMIFQKDHKLTISSKIALRAGLAILAAYIYACIFRNPYSAWVILTANLVLLVRKGDTIKKGFDRIFGHGVGFLFALALNFILQFYSSPFVFGPILIFFTAYYFLKNYFIYGIFLMMSIHYIYGLTMPLGFMPFPALHFLGIRLIDIVVGSLAAIIASHVIFPKAGVDNYHAFNHQVFRCMADYLKPFYNKNPGNFDREKNQSTFNDMISLFNKNTQIKNNLLFQTDRYTRSFAIYNTMYTLQDNLLLDITSFSWRYYHINQSYYNDPLARDFINKLIYDTSIEIDKLSAWCQQLIQSDNYNLAYFKTYTLNKMYIDTESFIEKNFLRIDNNEITVDQLIDEIGILRSLQNIIKKLLSIHLQSIH